ncbi:ABC transporter permease [Glaciimonas sp. PCH181]|uniref:ABC transporter permease n=1 Tax=Glaciimonas sp. PCH181 TaxID=2133943 RepID=UPI001374EECA|nr:ABC transporter permease [Glaciimonas sp. PCH181]
MRSIKQWPVSVWVCLALFVVCLIAVPRFGTASNFLNLGKVAAVLILVAIGQGAVIVIRGLDFSIGSGVAIFSVATVLCVPSLGIVPAFGIGMLAVLLLGLVNGALIGFLKLPAFLVTLGTMIAVHGFCSVIVGGAPLEAPTGIDLSGLANSQMLGLPSIVWLAIAACLIGLVVMQFTTFGRECYLIGSNPDAARLVGIPVPLRIMQAYLINAVLVALAGAILTSRLGSGQPNLYPELPFEAIAACAIGGIPLSGGQGGPVHAVIGVFILSMFVNALVLLNFPSYLQNILLGALIVGSVLVQRWGMRWAAANRRNVATVAENIATNNATSGAL